MIVTYFIIFITFQGVGYKKNALNCVKINILNFSNKIIFLFFKIYQIIFNQKHIKSSVRNILQSKDDKKYTELKV